MELSNWVNSFWYWLTIGESGSTTIRNIALVITAIVALWLTMRRIRVADRQAETAQQGLLSDRYQKGAEMLSSEVLAVRLGGIYALQRLATDHPEQFLRPIVRQYCAFVRHPPGTKGGETLSGKHASDADSKTLREDVRTVMNVIVGFSSHSETIDVAVGLSLDMRGADLSGVDLSGAQLSRANLSNADLSCSDLSRAFLGQAEVTDANLRNANVSGTRFSSGQPFSVRVRGLTQDQLDETYADPRCPPKLEGVVGPDGTPVQWRRKSGSQRRLCQETSQARSGPGPRQ